MADTSALAAFLEATVRIATPLGLAALGETVTERSGVINIGIEGAMLSGALAAALAAGAADSAGAGFLAGGLAGAAVAAVFAAFVLGLRADQIVVGAAITLGATGLTGAVYRAAFGTTGAALSLPTMAPVHVPLLGDIPILGAAFFVQPLPAYLLYVLAPALWYLLSRTQPGLALRAAGESPDAATAAGLRVVRLRAGATILGGILAGFAGATLVLAQAGTFAERMTAGRGYIAIAIVVLGRWNPIGVLAAALVFGGASALQFAFQALGYPVPYQFFLMTPYVLSLLALAGVGGQARSPAAGQGLVIGPLFRSPRRGPRDTPLEPGMARRTKNLVTDLVEYCLAPLARWHNQRLVVERVEVALRGLDPSFDGYRVAFLTDMHTSPIVPRWWLERSVQVALDLKADLIALGGDFLDDDPHYIAELGDILKPLRAPDGVVAVLGNHDHYVSAQGVREELDQAQIRELYNSSITVTRGAARLAIAGVGDLQCDVIDFDRALAGLPGGVPRIVLSHDPDVFAYWPPHHRLDLMLSGHTHGGQAYVPLLGPPFVPSQFGFRYLKGLMHEGDRQLYVSRGVGASGAPIRWRCPPELTELVLRPAR